MLRAAKRPPRRRAGRCGPRRQQTRPRRLSSRRFPGRSPSKLIHRQASRSKPRSSATSAPELQGRRQLLAASARRARRGAAGHGQRCRRRPKHRPCRIAPPSRRPAHGPQASSLTTRYKDKGCRAVSHRRAAAHGPRASRGRVRVPGSNSARPHRPRLGSPGTFRRRRASSGPAGSTGKPARTHPRAMTGVSPPPQRALPLRLPPTHSSNSDPARPGPAGRPPAARGSG